MYEYDSNLCNVFFLNERNMLNIHRTATCNKGRCIQRDVRGRAVVILGFFIHTQFNA